LGRNHTLEDVLSHNLRENLMDYITTQMEEDKQQAVRKAICSDLTDSQIEEYTHLVAEAKEERERAATLARKKSSAKQPKKECR